MGLKLSAIASKLNKNKGIQILMIGLDAAGKTTLLSSIGEVTSSVTSEGFYLRNATFKEFSFNTWDIDGLATRSRFYWRTLYKNPRGIIFVVDSLDRERISQARDQLKYILNVEELKKIPLLVLANKQDFQNAMTIFEVRDQLELNSIEGRQWKILGACGKDGTGFVEGLDWLQSIIEK